MNARIIDGKAIAADIAIENALRAARLRDAGTVPGLAVVIVGDDPASKVYVRNKALACEKAGLNSWVHALPANTPQERLIAFLRSLNADPTVHGILVQLPLPRPLDARAVIEAIDPAKDVDGFHVASAGALMIGRPGFKACTPYGCMKMLEAIGCNPKGKHAVVIGRSNIVGKPMAMMLLQANATVTVCHSATPDLAHHTRQADIVVAAVGKRNVLTADMVKPGAVIIDVGMNRNDEGKLCGDVDFPGVREVAGWITPVPGGVGPMTRAMLLVNTLEAAERAASPNA